MKKNCLLNPNSSDYDGEVGGGMKGVHTSVSYSKLNVLYGLINSSEMNVQ